MSACLAYIAVPLEIDGTEYRYYARRTPSGAWAWTARTADGRRVGSGQIPTLDLLDEAAHTAILACVLHSEIV